jgi:hypothetical protein
LHIEAVKPAIQFLSSLEYQSANDEYLDAYDFYKKGDYTSANNRVRQAFESLMKIICKKRGYMYDENYNLKELLGVLKKNNYFYGFMEDHLNHLIGLLQGVGTISNKKGSHGKGTNTDPIPAYLVGYILHAAASAMVLFSEIEQG